MVARATLTLWRDPLDCQIVGLSLGARWLTITAYRGDPPAFSPQMTMRSLDVEQKAGHSMATATALLGSFQILGTAWSAAAAGWLLAEMTPIAVRAGLEALGIARAARLRTERARLVEAWGPEASQEDQ